MMDDDKLRELRDALYRERDMTLAERMVRPDSEEPIWFGYCLALLSEVDRLRAEVGTLRLRPPVDAQKCPQPTDDSAEILGENPQ